jgi:hypothetical protein
LDEGVSVLSLEVPERRRLTRILYYFCFQLALRDAAEEYRRRQWRRRDFFQNWHWDLLFDDVVLLLLLLVVVVVT